MSSENTKRFVTMKHVAETAGVSVRTVTRFLNGNGYISEETRKKINTAIRQLDYYPNAVAQRLRDRRTLMIGLALYHTEYISDTSGVFFPWIVSGLIEAISQYGYGLQILATDPRTATEQKGVYYLDKLRGHSLDGLVVVDAVISEKDIVGLQNYHTPFVVLNRLVRPIAGRCVVVDNESAGYCLARFLIQRGHRKIACWGAGLTTDEKKAFYEGMRRAASEKSDKMSGAQVILMAARQSSLEAASRKLIRELNSPSGSGISAVVCGSVLTTNLLAELLRRGMRVRKGFEFAGPVSDPESIADSRFVYAVKSAAKELGRCGGEILLDQINHNRVRREATYVKPQEYVQPTYDLDHFMFAENII
jgi:LacI family transcriptional regulator